MTKPITIYTFDGTASAGASIPSNPGNQGVPSNVGGGYPAELADRLVKADPTVWNWYPVDYVPNRALGPDWRPVSRNVLDAYNGGTVSATSNYTDRPSPGANPVPVANRVIPSVKSAILNTPGKFVLSGLSQGTIAVGYFLNELRYGQLQSRLPDLLGVYNFGDAFRPKGWSVPLQGAMDPGGAGALNLSWVQSYGNSTGLHQPTRTPVLSPEVYWSFSNLNDAASSVVDTAQPLIGRIAQQIMYGDPTLSPSKIILFYDRNGVPNGAKQSDPNYEPNLTGLLANFGSTPLDFLAGLIMQVLNVLNIRTWLTIGENAARAANTWAGRSLLRLIVDEVIGWRGRGAAPQFSQVLSMILQWWPFAIGGLGLDDVTLSSANPHAKYSRPFSYTALRYNATDLIGGGQGYTPRGAVQLAFDRLHALGKTLYPHTTPVSPAPAAKQYWLLTFGKYGEFFDPATAASVWPTPNALGLGAGSGGTVSSSPYGDVPVTVTGDFGRRNTDSQQSGVGAQVFSALSTATKAKVEWVPVSYNAAAFPSVIAARAAVDRAVALILASPVGTKFFVVGHGLGAVVSSLLWDEFQGGRLVARKNDIRTFYHFGNPVRPSSHGIPLARANKEPADAGGEGVAARQTGIRLKPMTFNQTLIWEFANPSDPIAAQQATSINTSPQAMLRAAFNVCWQNAPSAGLLQPFIRQQARTDLTTVSVPAARDMVVSLYSTAANAHNGYATFIPRPVSRPNKSAIQLAVDDINSKAV